MKKRAFTRRAFLGLAAAAAVVIPGVGCPWLTRRKGVVVHRRSCKGTHSSNAAKKHAANHLYKTQLAAFMDQAHPGDNAKVVQVTISQDLYNKLFRFGRLDADLRQIL